MSDINQALGRAARHRHGVRGRPGAGDDDLPRAADDRALTGDGTEPSTCRPLTRATEPSTETTPQ